MHPQAPLPAAATGTRLCVGVLLGAKQSRLTVNDGQNHQNLFCGPDTGPVEGLSLNVPFTRNSCKLSLEVDLFYEADQYDQMVQNPPPTLATASYAQAAHFRFDLAYLRVPLLIRYTFPKGRLRPLLEAGLVGSYALKTTNSVQTTNIFGQVGSERTAFDSDGGFRHYEQSYTAGAGWYWPATSTATASPALGHRDAHGARIRNAYAGLIQVKELVPSFAPMRTLSCFTALAWVLLTGTGLLASSCQRGPLVATAHLAPSTSQPVGSALPPDAGAAAYIRPYHEQVEREMQQVIGTAPEALGKNPGENAIVDFVADLQRTAASQYFKGEPIALGVMTNGGMRNALPAGPVTLGNVFELMPFENELVVLDAPGPVVQQLFDYAAPVHMAISGASYTVGPDNKPQAIRIGGQSLDPGRTYSIAISDYLAGGGDHMDFLKAARLRHTGLLLRTAIVDHIKALTAAGQPVAAPAGGRVQ